MSQKMTKPIRGFSNLLFGRYWVNVCSEKLGLAKVTEVEASTNRAIAFEPLEMRQLMAADFFNSAAMAAEANGLNNYLSTAGSEVARSSQSITTQTTAEGEAAQDLVAFAKSLRDAGVIFFGADWCPNCSEQKRLFEDGSQFLNVVEVTNPDRTANARGIAENVTVYPTWQFQNGSRQTGVLTLAQLSTASGIAIPTSSTPSIAPIAATTVLRGSPLHIPVDAYDPNGNPLTITVTSSNPSAVSAEVLGGNQSAIVRTANFGDMVFELFSSEASRPVNQFSTLTNQSFYDTVGTNRMIFHRVIQNFVIQGGDPTGTGTGGSPLPNFDDQFNLNLQHNRSGILSYAKSSDDTNDSQFFITAGPTRNLDFNHSILGQLVEGDSTRQGIARTSVNSSDKPINDAVINSIDIFNDTENGLVRLRAIGASGATSTITVTATDTEGNQTSQTFVVTIANDASNGSPFLNDIPTINASAGQTTTYQLAAQDKEGDTRIFSAVLANGVTAPFTSNSVSVNSATGLLSITPPTSFTGSFQVRASVRQTADANANDQFDTQLITVNVASTAPAAPTSIDLDTASDSGANTSDNVTRTGTLSFTVSGTVVGATVTLKSGTNTLGSAIATGTTTTISTANLAALGDGTRVITATQTVNSVESVASPSLSVTFDATQPVSLGSNPFPASIPSEQAFSVNLFHPEEGAGLVYSLTSAPTGMIINASTGAVTWNPTAGQIGNNTFTVNLTDTAGNVRSENFSMNVAAAALGAVTIRLVDLNNAPITSVTIGQVFKVQLVARDLRTSGNDGVFAAYTDLNYNSVVVALEGSSPITRLNGFDVSPDGNTSTLGLINEVGGARSSSNPSGAAGIVFAEVQFRATAAGQANFTTDAAETQGRDFLVYGSQVAVDKARISFGNNSLAIGRNFTVVDDIFNFNEDSSNNTVDVLANDTIVPSTNTVISIISVSTPSAGGSLTIASDNRSLRYTPIANYNGGEVFTYTVRDNTGAEATGTVTVQVQPVNDPPVATADSYTFIEGSTDNFLEVLLNDSSGVDQGETLTVSQVGTPSQGGAARINGGSNAILYTPRTGFVGSETLTYTVRDNNGGTASTTVTILVNPRVPPPIAGNDSFTVVEDAAVAEFSVLVNDTPNVTGRALSVATPTASQGGSVLVTTDGLRLRYAPRANFSGTEIVTYTLRETGGSTATGTVTFTVTAVNDAPLAVDDNLTVLSQPNQILNVLANDTDVDSGDVLTITAITQPPTGQGTVAIQNNRIVYSAPNTEFTGTVTFTYTASDAAGLTDTATVQLTVQNFTPRTISGQLRSGSSGSGATGSVPQGNIAAISGLGLNFTGTSFDGSLVNQRITADADGDFAVPNLAPGNYSFSLPTLPFATNPASSISVQSAFVDGNMSGVNLPVGNIQARYIDIRDFTSSRFNRGFMVAITPGQTAQHWVAAYGAWRDYSSLTMTLNTAGNSLTVRATNAAGQAFTGTIAVSGNNASTRATEGNARLIRVLSTPSQVTLTPVTSGSSASSVSNNSIAPRSTSTNTPSTNTSTGEGEGSPSVANRTDAAMSQVNPSIEVSSSLASSLAISNQSQMTSNYDSVYAEDLDELLKRKS